MTTIAYSRAAGVVAADTQTTYGGMKLRSCKVHRLPCGGLVGAAGLSSHCARVIRWAVAGFPSDDMPDFSDSDDGADVECFYVTGAGQPYLLPASMEPIPLLSDIVAIGSGAGYAMGAMRCGKTPGEAVLIAAEFDASTSAPVDEMKIEPTKPKAKIRKGR